MKTIEKAATHFSEDIRENSLSGNNAGKEQYKVGRKIGFKTGVEFAQRWIDPKEELPEVGVLVQIKLTEFIRNSIYYDHDRVIDNNGFKMFDCEQCAVRVIGWRYIELK